MELLMLMALFLALSYALSHLITALRRRRDQQCYMLAYQCYKPPESSKLTTDACAKIVMRNKSLGFSEFRFLLNIIVSSGIGEDTYCPKAVLEGHEERPTLDDALAEMDDILFQTLDRLFDKTGVSPREIDILVVNVSLFSPAPSLASRVVNRYRMREDVKTYNLSGMGCSASVVAIDLVRQLFRTHSNKYAVVVSTESFGPNWYCGKEKSMMLSNCLFRLGGCSVLLTNKSSLRDRAILKLKCLVRTNLAADDEAYRCCFEVEDDKGHQGIRLSRKLPQTAAKGLRENLRSLAPKILPLTEILRYGASSLRRKKSSSSSSSSDSKMIDFKAGVEHFCIHPGGRAVIDGVGMSLGLEEYDLEPSRMTLHRFGNTSAGGFYYVLGYMEAKRRIKRGDRVLMMCFGAGFKCNTCLWEAMRDLGDDESNVWNGIVENYPVTSVVNPFAEKYSWINDDYLGFVRM